MASEQPRAKLILYTAPAFRGSKALDLFAAFRYGSMGYSDLTYVRVNWRKFLLLGPSSSAVLQIVTKVLGGVSQEVGAPHD